MILLTLYLVGFFFATWWAWPIYTDRDVSLFGVFFAAALWPVLLVIGISVGIVDAWRESWKKVR